MSNETVSEENQLQALYIDLNKACTVTDYEKVINITNKILKKYPDEIKAFHCKIISMMHMEKFNDSLKLIDENPNFSKDLLFEKAYCEYRLNRLDDAIATIKSSNENDLRIQELLGQILYKQEQYEEALEKYRFLMRNVPDAYEEERIVNMTATISAMTQWDRKKKDFPNVPENMFEISFNKACHLAALSRYEEALKKLKEAEEMCMHAFENDQDVTSAEIDEELAVIKVQEAYCLQKLNKHQEASTIYHEMIKKRCGDTHVLAVAANNVVCINKDQNIFDSRKKIKMTIGDTVKSKLISGQRQEIAVNNLLFQYYSNQGEAVKTVSDNVLKIRPLCVRTALIKAAQLVKEKQTSSAISFMQSYLEVVEKTDIPEMDLVRVQLSLAQLHLVHGSVSQCNDILGDLPIGYRHRFGVLGTRISLYVMTEDIQAALDCLDTALDWYKNEAAVFKRGHEKEQRVREYDTLLKVAANFAMRHKRPECGARYYEQLLHTNANDQSILASLIAAYSRFDKAQAHKYINLLKDEKQLPEVDVDSLECAFIFGVKHMKKLLKGEVTPSSKVSSSGGGGKKTPVVTSLKAKKKSKTKLPKNYDPSKMPDPERWLPKRERAHFRNKKSYKRTNAFRGPQGATVGAPDLDASKKAAPQQEPTTSPAAEPLKKAQTKSKAGSGSAGANKKAKNKKKGKW